MAKRKGMTTAGGFGLFYGIVVVLISMLGYYGTRDLKSWLPVGVGGAAFVGLAIGVFRGHRMSAIVLFLLFLCGAGISWVRSAGEFISIGMWIALWVALGIPLLLGFVGALTQEK